MEALVMVEPHLEELVEMVEEVTLLLELVLVVADGLPQAKIQHGVMDALVAQLFLHFRVA
jgi:hypothetical protein